MSDTQVWPKALTHWDQKKTLPFGTRILFQRELDGKSLTARQWLFTHVVVQRSCSGVVLAVPTVSPKLEHPMGETQAHRSR